MKEAFEKIKERLEELINEPRCLHEYDDCCDGINEAIKIVSEVEAEYGNGWIPCIERLPSHKHNLLLCLKSGYVGEGYYSADGFKDVNSYPYEDVIAWMPLPEPYKPEKGA